jgi:ribosomal protein L29
MAVLRINDARKLNEKERAEKMVELRLELVKGAASANKAKAKTKEVKRAIARLLTLSKQLKEESAK